MRVSPHFPGFQVSGVLVSKSLTLQGRESGQRRAVGSREQGQHVQVLRKLVLSVSAEMPPNWNGKKGATVG